jgi:hypothetical protein
MLVAEIFKNGKETEMNRRPGPIRIMAAALNTGVGVEGEANRQ